MARIIHFANLQAIVRRKFSIHWIRKNTENIYNKLSQSQMYLKLLFIGAGILLIGIVVFFLKSCGKPVPKESQRFADQAPVAEFEIPAERPSIPADRSKEIKDSVRNANILPFTFFDQHHFFFVNKDQENVYVSMDYHADLEQSDPAEAAKRKDYRGISAFELATKKHKWTLAFSDPSTCSFAIDPASLRIGPPYLLGDKLLVIKKNYSQQLDNCYLIIEKNTGKILKMEGMQGGLFDVEYGKYLVRYEYKKSIRLINPENGEHLWNYTLDKELLGDGTTRLKLLNDRVFYYDFQKEKSIGFDFIDISSGSLLARVEFAKADLVQTSLKPLAMRDHLLYFEVDYCSTTGFELRPADCEYCFIQYDTKSKQVLKRTAYAK